MKALPQESSSPFDDDLKQAQVPVLGYLVRLTGNLADARDLLQQTNLTAWEKRETYDPGTNPVAWMRSIARNHYRNEVRKRSGLSMVPLLDRDLETMIENRHEEREREETRKRKLLHVCLEKLPERQREAVEKFYLDGSSLEEVGKATRRRVNAVAQLLHRARQNLIRCVRQESHRELEGDELFE